VFASRLTVSHHQIEKAMLQITSSLGEHAIVVLTGGLRFPAGIHDAVLHNCTVGDDVLIRNVHQGISNYDIDHDAVICDVSSMTVDGETSFGNGQLVHVLREDATIPTPICDQLSSNIAFLFTSLRHQPDVKARIRRLIDQYVAGVTAGRGRICAHATVLNCGALADVRIGPSAKVYGALKLANCSLNSTSESPVEVGEGVILRDSIVSSGTIVDGAAIVTNSFLGQGVRVGRQFSLRDTLVFANSEFYHGEARSLLAGPFTVSHHKSALLIATQASFFHVGSVVKGRKIYSRAIEAYLAERIVERLESIPPKTDPVEALAKTSIRRPPRELDWCEIGGFYTPVDGVRQLAKNLVLNEFSDVRELQSAMHGLWEQFENDLWEWVFNVWLGEIGKSSDELTDNDLVVAVRTWKANAAFFCRANLEDCLKDLATSAMWERDLDVFGGLPPVPNSLSIEAHDHPVATSLKRELREIDSRAEALLSVLNRNESESQGK